MFATLRIICSYTRQSEKQEKTGLMQDSELLVQIHVYSSTVIYQN